MACAISEQVLQHQRKLHAEAKVVRLSCRKVLHR